MQIDFFGDTPDEVVDKLKNKMPTLTDDLDKIKGDAYKKAFTISGIAKTSLLADIQESMIKALEKGKGFDEWRSDLFDDLEGKGWANKFETLNDDEVNVLGDSARLKLIYDTNIRSAYAQASYESGIASGAKYIRYVAVLDHRTRQTHADMHGIIKPINDPWWNINYPPNGFNCRCSVMFLKDGDLKARGWEDKVNNATLPNIAENGFKKHSGEPYAFNATAKRLQNQNLERIKANDEIITANFGKDAPKLSEKIESEFKNLETKRLKREIEKLFIFDNQKVELTKSNILGKTKSVYLSSDTVKSHLHHKDITADDYIKIPQILQGKKQIFKQDESRYVVLATAEKNYRLTIKNIENKDEIYSISLVKLKSNGGIGREAKKLLKKFKEIIGVANPDKES